MASAPGGAGIWPGATPGASPEGFWGAAPRTLPPLCTAASLLSVCSRLCVAPQARSQSQKRLFACMTLPWNIDGAFVVDGWQATLKVARDECPIRDMPDSWLDRCPGAPECAPDQQLCLTVLKELWCWLHTRGRVVNAHRKWLSSPDGSVQERRDGCDCHQTKAAAVCQAVRRGGARGVMGAYLPAHDVRPGCKKEHVEAHREGREEESSEPRVLV